MPVYFCVRKLFFGFSMKLTEIFFPQWIFINKCIIVKLLISLIKKVFFTRAVSFPTSVYCRRLRHSMGRLDSTDSSLYSLSSNRHGDHAQTIGLEVKQYIFLSRFYSRYKLYYCCRADPCRLVRIWLCEPFRSGFEFLKSPIPKF